jgi:hypothetical protein
MAPINQALTPLVRAGAVSPWPLGTGLVLLEVTGRRTGRLHTVPLVCTDYGAFQVVSTVRAHSQWVRNLAAAPEAGLWLRGRRRDVIATVYRAGECLTDDAPMEDCPGAAASALSRAAGISIAVLAPR